MGMYTELVLAANLREPAPQQVVDTLAYMVGRVSTEPVQLPAHPLFGLPRWSGMLRCDSYYFAGDTHSSLIRDGIGRGFWSLTIRSNFKNYHGEVEAFVDWISPHLDANPGDFLGYSRYEEAELPTLIFCGPVTPEPTEETS